MQRMMEDPAMYQRARDEARQRARSSFDHLYADDLLQRLTSTDIVIGEDSEDAEPVEPVRPRRPTPVARQMALPPTLPRLISRDASAAYVGVSPNTFDQMVTDRLMPKPRRLTERRLAWDVRQLDAAIDRLPVDGGFDTDTDDTPDRSWEDIDAKAKTKPAVR